MVVTSPPYYALRDYKIEDQLGLEKRADCLGWATGQPCGECYICQMVAVFGEVKRVLRKDGVCFLNIGDSYAGGGRGPGGNGTCGTRQTTNHGSIELDPMLPQDGLKPKDMLLIPQRLALALQSNGWWIRSEIIWHKPNPMPESVTDRPTKSHETIWLISKSARYYWDAEAVREKADDEEIRYRVELRTKNAAEYDIKLPYQNNFPNGGRMTGGRNMRDVWTIPTQSYSGAHYATYPEALVEKCINAGTSERGACPKCGKQWERVTERQNESTWQLRKSLGATGGAMNEGPRQQVGTVRTGVLASLPTKDNVTVDWQPSCNCSAAYDGTWVAQDDPAYVPYTPIPATVLDPFAGSGTTLLVAKRMGRKAIGLDLSYQYLRENAWERVQMNAPTLFDALSPVHADEICSVDKNSDRV